MEDINEKQNVYNIEELQMPVGEGNLKYIAKWDLSYLSLPNHIQQSYSKILTNVAQNLHDTSGGERRDTVLREDLSKRRTMSCWNTQFSREEVLAVVSDTFWFVITRYFKTGDYCTLEDQIIYRLSKNFALLNEIIPMTYHDLVFSTFASSLAQILFQFFFLLFPKSRASFSSSLRRELGYLTNLLFNGTYPEFFSTKHWTLNLGRGNILPSEEENFANATEEIINFSPICSQVLNAIIRNPKMMIANYTGKKETDALSLQSMSPSPYLYSPVSEFLQSDCSQFKKFPTSIKILFDCITILFYKLSPSPFMPAETAIGTAKKTGEKNQTTHAYSFNSSSTNPFQIPKLQFSENPFKQHSLLSIKADGALSKSQGLSNKTPFSEEGALTTTEDKRGEAKQHSLLSQKRSYHKLLRDALVFNLFLEIKLLVLKDRDILEDLSFGAHERDALCLPSLSPPSPPLSCEASLSSLSDLGPLSSNGKEVFPRVASLLFEKNLLSVKLDRPTTIVNSLSPRSGDEEELRGREGGERRDRRERRDREMELSQLSKQQYFFDHLNNTHLSSKIKRKINNSYVYQILLKTHPFLKTLKPIKLQCSSGEISRKTARKFDDKIYHGLEENLTHLVQEAERVRKLDRAIETYLRHQKKKMHQEITDLNKRQLEILRGDTHKFATYITSVHYMESIAAGRAPL